MAQTLEVRVLLLVCAWSFLLILTSYIATMTFYSYAAGFLVIFLPVALLLSVLAGTLTSFGAIAGRSIALRAHAKRGAAQIVAGIVSAPIAAVAITVLWSLFFAPGPPAWATAIAGVSGGICAYVAVRSQDR